MSEEFRPQQFPAVAILERIKSALVGSEVKLQDTQGNGYHYDLIVVWDGFEVLSRIRQHQSVLNLFKDEFSANHLHAMTLKTYTRKTWEEAQKSQGKVSIK